jgi:phosphoribosylaminoimidazole carboxylase PurE protein
MVASATLLPVIGVPVNVTSLKGLDALLAVVQMPKGVPVATVAIDNAANAGLLAIRILANSDFSLKSKLTAFRQAQVKKVNDANAKLAKKNEL